MKTLRFAAALSFAVFCQGAGSASAGEQSQQASASGATKGADVTGTSVKGGSVTGGTVTGGSVTGGSVTGGSVTGGSVTGGTVTGGSVTGGTVSSGTVTPGTITSGSVGPARATAKVNGREITASVIGSVSIDSSGDKATVSLNGHQLVIEKERILLDGKERGKLAPGETSIAINSTGTDLTVNAGGKEVLKSGLKPRVH